MAVMDPGNEAWRIDRAKKRLHAGNHPAETIRHFLLVLVKLELDGLSLTAGRYNHAGTIPLNVFHASTLSGGNRVGNVRPINLRASPVLGWNGREVRWWCGGVGVVHIVPCASRRVGPGGIVRRVAGPVVMALSPSISPQSPSDQRPRSSEG